MDSTLMDKVICVTGGMGFLGKHVITAIRSRGVPECQIIVPRSDDYDLRREADTVRLMNDANPDIVIHLAALVGGIGANRDHPGRFFHDNMVMGLNVIEQSRLFGIERFVLTGTVCAYPKHCPVPFREDDLWKGFPEETNAPYGVAKRALQVMLDGYKREYGFKSAYLLPVNLYGPYDNFDPHTSHVIPALIRKIEIARRDSLDNITCWGTGSATREFLFVADAAEAIVRAAERIDDPCPINLGTGSEISIRDLVVLIAEICNYQGDIRWDSSFPDGQPRRCLDTSRALKKLDWTSQIPLQQGLSTTVNWFRRSHLIKSDYT